MASPATSSTIIMSSTWASVVPAGKVPKDTAPPFRRPLCPSWRAGFEPTPTKSGASKASRLILGSWERRRPGPASAASRSLQKTTCHERTCSWSAGRAGELVDQGQQIEVSAGHEPEDVAPVSSSPRTSDPQPVTPEGTISNPVSSSTRASVGRDTAPGISLLMEWWTIHHRAALQSLARDARRSHRSVEGDDLSNV